MTETALTNALNTSFFAEQVAMFGIVVGVALLLSGFGFGILAFTAFRWLPAQEKKKALKTAAKPVVAVGAASSRPQRAPRGPLSLSVFSHVRVQAPHG